MQWYIVCPTSVIRTSRLVSLAIGDHEETETGDEDILQEGIIVHHNCNIAHVWEVSLRTTDFVAGVDPELALIVQRSVVSRIIVALRQDFDAAAAIRVDLSRRDEDREDDNDS